MHYDYAIVIMPAPNHFPSFNVANEIRYSTYVKVCSIATVIVLPLFQVSRVIQREEHECSDNGALCCKDTKQHRVPKIKIVSKFIAQFFLISAAPHLFLSAYLFSSFPGEGAA